MNTTKNTDTASAPQSVGLGDVVSFQWNDGYDNGTVCQVHLDGTVDVFRPYVHTAKSACAGEDGGSRVICYIGTETVRHVNPSRCKVLHRLRTPLL